MGLDIRIPIGLLLLVIGGLLSGYGIFGDKAVYARSLGINVNLWWGLCLLLIGVVFLCLARLASAAAGHQLAQEQPDRDSYPEP